MLLLGDKTFTVSGITVFADHADPAQFWYLPAPVGLASRAGDDKEPQFTFIKYKPAVVAAGVSGGGFLLFTVALPLSKDAEREITGRLLSDHPEISNPRLAPVPFDDGTVQCIALDLQGPGGTAHPTVPGAFVAVETIHGTSTPSLYGDDDAAFGLSLSQDGAVLLERAFDDENTPIGAIYSLKFTGVRPALDVKITADLKRCYEGFSIGLTAEVYYVSVGIDAAFEKLRQDGAVKVEVINLTTDEENKKKEQWALDFFKEQLVADWFRPSLSPATATQISTMPSPSGTPTPTPTGSKSGAGSALSSLTDAAEKNKPKSPYSVALRLRYVQQDEKKTITVEYNRMDAVQRTYGPQGFFGLLLKGVDRDKHFRAIDLDDPFFRKLVVTLTPPADFTGIGLSDLHVALDYGEVTETDQPKHGEFIFDAQNHARTTWVVFKNANGDSNFSYRVDYHFDPQSGWDGEKLTYSLPPRRTENQELYINPYEVLGFFQIRLTPGRIDWNALDYIEVDLEHRTSTGYLSRKHLEFRSGSPVQIWKLRVADKQDDLYTWRATHHLISGIVISAPKVTTRAPAIVVEDPFIYGLNLIFQPSLSPANIKVAYVDTSYEDADHGYLREDNVALVPNGPAARLRIPLLDPAKRRYKFRVTLIGPPPQNQVQRGAWVETEETLQLITDTGAV